MIEALIFHSGEGGCVFHIFHAANFFEVIQK
nr:MAG TPA: hypothetical protein [Caudoviricetes sp.]